MPGKIKARLIKGSLPKSKFWVPKDCGLSEIYPNKDSDQTIVSITVAEWETLRLCDLENCKQRDVAHIMHLSQPTVNRLLSKAHTKIAQALFNGYILKFESDLLECPKCKENLSTKAIAGKINCPNCNHYIDIKS